MDKLCMIGILGLIWCVYKSERRVWIDMAVDLAMQSAKSLSTACRAEQREIKLQEEMKKVKAQLGAAKGTITKLKKKEGKL
jgi:hypothetical protein